MNILVSAHSGLRWIALVLLLLAIYNAFTAKEYEKKHRLVNMFAMISLHTQLLIGLALYFTSDKVQFIEGWMKSPLLRFFGMEHLAGMLIAIVLVTIGHSKSKKATESSDKFKAIKLWYVLALILILAFIPWPFRTVLGAGWF
jgi:membrane protein DedA with SNARE-associated domain